MPEPKYFIKTFGCQANKSDSERIAGDYQARGFSPAATWREADEIVINTCSVRQRAEDRVQGFLLNVEKYFTKGPEQAGRARCRSSERPKIILTGCMLHHGAKNLKINLPLIDEVLPIAEVGFNSPAVRADKNHAFIPISSGCNSFCTFCIVPYSRGREFSRPAAEILSEVEGLAATGYTEITLLGQNVNSYGLEKAGIGYRKLLMSRAGFTVGDIPSNQSQYFPPDGLPPFVTLLRQISRIAAIGKINFMTSNPWDFADELIAEIAANPKISRFVHLPVQSGSDRILSLMNRGYTRADFLTLINKIKKAIPDVTFGTDIIVGFPGETDTDFMETVDLVKQVDFQVAFVAQYSPRPGTAAWRIYPDDVPAKVKKERFRILEELTNRAHLHHRPYVP
ncbi:MAG TPA: MiaB/RimO family radical SAM methylthiotransferase [Patescibacteria group bacterium]|nr:MiaB/RimO family radical SAM methylthiotransferase [Patescibacteria group bacterium]